MKQQDPIKVRDGQPFRRLAPSSEPTIDTETGRATFIFNTEEVGRDGHIVRNAGIRTANYDTNPVILFGHNDQEPPIGRATAIRIADPACTVEIEFTPRDLYPFGATIGEMVKARYLNACSESWMPIKWRFMKDRSGVIFDEVDLLEISVVPIPALPDAVATARAAGIDTGPLVEWAERILDTGGLIALPRDELESLRRAAKMPKPVVSRSAAEWKVGASKDLPIEDSDSWDGSAAEKSIFEYAGGDEFDSAKARKGFLVYNAAEPDKRSSYKLPIAHAVDGELKVPKGAIRAAASRLSQTDIPEDVMKRAQAVLDHYEEKSGIGDDTEEERALKSKHARALARAPKVPVFRRGLYEVANLACMLESLGYCHNASEYEAAIEGDSSPVPGMLGEALKAFGEALIAMTEEEVKELLEQHDDGEEEDLEAETRKLTAKDRSYVADAKNPRVRAWRAGIAVARVGKALSATNQEHLDDADGHLDRAMKHHRALGEHHDAVKEHMDSMAEAHDRATSSLEDLGEHLRAAKENPGKAAEHVDAAVTKHRTVASALSEATEEHRDMADRHADVGDSHQALGRAVKGAQRCVRAVLAVSTEADEPEEEEEDSQSRQGKAQRERAARAARAAEIAKLHREPITLD